MSAGESTVTQKGQVTIPAEIREQLGIKPKDKVRFEVEDGVIVIKPIGSRILANYGSVTPLHRPEDFRALRKEFEIGVAEEVMARLRQGE